MANDRIPHNLAAHLHAVLTAVVDEALSSTINRLFHATHVTEDELRLGFLQQQQRGKCR